MDGWMDGWMDVLNGEGEWSMWCYQATHEENREHEIMVVVVKHSA